MSIACNAIMPAMSPVGTPGMLIDITGIEDIKRMKRVLDRSLNCDPEAGADLFEMADNMDAFIRAYEERNGAI